MKLSIKHGGLLICIALFWTQYLGIVCFLFGFLPMKNPVAGYASPEDYTSFYKGDSNHGIDLSGLDKPERMVGQLVFMVIDALRADFVFPFEHLNQTGLKFKRMNNAGSYNPDKYKIAFLSKLLSQPNNDDIEVMGFLAQVHAPTVTMPRIKALTTGSIPGFVDVILNFGSKDLGQDSILEQWKRGGRNITMFGDDTWLGLFPNHFVRSDGTTSFFVSDYTEVDKNVTRHLKDEMKQNDWDVSILHYLGLDHIGHLSGPKSPLIPKKLGEMGDVIREISSALFKKPWKENLPPMILVLGDHGMADAGGHGGASLVETVTPVVALFPSQFSKGNANRKKQKAHPSLIKQHDLASTLSLLTGVAIPQNNIGTFNFGLLQNFLPNEEGVEKRKQFMCFYNLEQISSCMKAQFSWYQETQGYKRYLRIKRSVSGSNDKYETDMTKECELAIHEMSGILEENMSSYNIKGMLFGIGILFLNVLLFGWWYIQSFSWEIKFGSLEALLFLLNILRLLSFGSTSFIEEEHQSIYFFTISIVIAVFNTNISSNDLSNKKELMRNDNIGTRIGHVIFVLFLLRISRTINQTGDKWLYLPDFSDYLQKPENQNLLIMVHAASVFILIATRIRHMSKWKAEPTPIYVLSIGLLVVSHLTIVLQKLPKETLANMFYSFDTNPEETKIYLAQLVYLLSFLYFVLRVKGAETFSNCCQVFLDGSLVVFSLLVQPYSTCLLPIALIIEEILFYSMKNVSRDWGAIYYLFGLSTYFQMGNSNSLASVDVGAGYTGISSFNPVIVCLLMAVNTFNGPIIWSLCLFCRLNHNPKTTTTTKTAINDHRPQLETVLKSVGFYRSIELLFITIVCTICRFHIMVWTVFAPKVLYEMMFSLMMALVLSLIYVIQKLFVTKENKNKNV